MKELAFERYLSKKDELKEIGDRCKEVFVAQIDNTSNREEQITKALEFIKAVWKKYDCEEIANIYDKFVKMEEALFGLERESDLGKRYRDHFVHMFNCFVFGLRIITSLLEQSSSKPSKDMFKVQNESLKEVGLPFGSNYRYDQRLFYLWTLVSTFHDIAIPFQHLAGLGRGISRFIEEFGWDFTDPQVSMHNFDSSQLYYYFNLIGYVYGGQLKLVDGGRKYARPKSSQYYIAKLLGREFDLRNHGVLSGFFMWKTIEEIFLVGRSKKYPLNLKQFNKYTEYVLEQDIARAALAISLHGIKEDKKSNAYPGVFPIAFGSYPLTFLLILSDELQEYLRWEGVSVRKSLKFNYHPIIDLKYDRSNHVVTMSVCFSLDGKNEDTIIERANEMAKASGVNSCVSGIDGAVNLIGNSIKKTLERKLTLGGDFRLTLDIYQDWNKELYSKKLISKKRGVIPACKR